MSFGIYVHVPYCLQRCTYCDFATYEQSQIMPPAQYFELVQEELRQKSALLSPRKLDTVYFGGGTPSLVPAEHIVALLSSLTRHGFTLDASTEITIEINPATIDPRKMEMYLNAGVNRFSVGAQTFDDALLKSVHREHTAAQTRETLRLLKSYGVNFSLDLLFALPGQKMQVLQDDLTQILDIHPPHISPYCLTVPEGHVLSTGRPLEDEQIEMFELIRTRLVGAGYKRYEISNFAKPGFESRHNSLYWSDDDYWGIGLGAHSYIKKGSWGMRFWNPNPISIYEQQIKKFAGQQLAAIETNLPTSQHEWLEKHQALTDFCHISLRRSEGLSQTQVQKKFGSSVAQHLSGPLAHLVEQGLLSVQPQAQDKSLTWCLTEQGLLLSNQVFGQLTFLAGELPSP
jgi:oxygen-independent coproporphyrinogen-3 oxidase